MSKDEKGNYQFVEHNVKYMISQDGKMFISTDSGVNWAEIHKRDVEFMAKRFGLMGDDK